MVGKSFDNLSAAKRADVVVLGSGPGGSITACQLAEAGRDVLMIEEGAWRAFDPNLAFTRREMVEKYRNGGVTAAMGSTNVAYVEGRCVGGGSEINSGLYHRTPPEILDQWRNDYRLDGLEDLPLHFESCERDLSVSNLPGQAPAASRKLKAGASRLGWESMEVPRWQKYEALEDADDENVANGRRQTMSATYVPRFWNAGGRLLPQTRARRLRREAGGWRIQTRHQGADGAGQCLEIRAKNVFIACGAIQTPLLLRRSGFSRNVGNQLQMHPTVKVVARFPENINAMDMGVPVHQVKEFAPRISFGCSISTPAHLALAMIDHPEHGPQLMQDWPKAAVYYAMVTGKGRGTVRSVPGFDDPLVRYRLEDEDYKDLATGLRRLCRVLLAAGATTLFCGLKGVPPIRGESDLAVIPPVLPRGRTNLMTIHLFSTCPMGEDRQRCPVDSFGKVHGTDGLYVADASLLCAAPSVNPQGSVMAFARRNAFDFLESSKV